MCLDAETHGDLAGVEADLLGVALQDRDRAAPQAGPRHETVDECHVGARADVHSRGLIHVTAQQPRQARRLSRLEIVRVTHRDEGAAPLPQHDQPLTLQAPS